jgi:hypothetical protein
MYGTSDLSNSNDIEYQMNITLGGALYTVLIDTGSSDLWVAADSVPNSIDSGKTAGVQYAIGAAKGPILFADLEFAGYTVPHQALFRVDPDADHAASVGLIGLGPWFVSSIYETLNSTAGLPPVDNIFRQNKTTPNYLTVLLGRSDDPVDAFPGDITVGELLAGYEDVQTQPKLPVDWAKYGDQHWSILLDEDGIIGPDGNPIPVTTKVSSTKNKQQLTAMFDTGYTLPQVPASVASGIYSQIVDANLKNITGLGPTWTMPCDREVNITFKAGGKSYPVHPLDATIAPADLGLTGDYCIGMFQPIASSASSRDVDMILGMAFLRNVYLLVNYGNFVPNETTTTQPYIQLLSTSNDTSLLHSEFVQVRLNGTDTTGDQQILMSSNTNTGSGSKVHNFLDRSKKYIIIGAITAGVILLLSVVLCCCCCRRSRSNSKELTASSWVATGGARYQPLDEPAPQAATDIHAAPQYTEAPSTAYHPPQGSWNHYRDNSVA